jgi:hypothetical protein
VTSRVNNVRSTDRILVLKPIDGAPRDSAGLLDKKLFSKGEDANRLHVVMDPQTCLWSFKYDKGIVPPIFKQSFTSFYRAYDFAEGYMKRRNIEIIEVLD